MVVRILIEVTTKEFETLPAVELICAIAQQLTYWPRWSNLRLSLEEISLIKTMQSLELHLEARTNLIASNRFLAKDDCCDVASLLIS